MSKYDTYFLMKENEVPDYVKTKYPDFFDPEAKPLVPAMALGVEECCRRGIIAKYIRGLTLENIQTTGVEGELLDTLEVEKLDIHDQK